MDYIKIIDSLVEAGKLVQLSGPGIFTNESSKYKAWELRVLNFVGKLGDDISYEAYTRTFSQVKHYYYKVDDVLALLHGTKFQIENGEIESKDSASQEVMPTRKQYDVFLSHANNDKLAYVDSLYSSLRKLGIKIFYDIEELTWGDNWKQVILDGVAKSEFAIVVISKAFFGREWTERELNEFLQRQNDNGQKLILPLLFEVSYNEVQIKFYYFILIACVRCLRRHC